MLSGGPAVAIMLTTAHRPTTPSRPAMDTVARRANTARASMTATCMTLAAATITSTALRKLPSQQVRKQFFSEDFLAYAYGARFRLDCRMGFV